MAMLIVKSPYIKCGGEKSAGGYLKYIATRERVEIIPDDRPPTNKQEQLIAKLVEDFPDAKELMEYEDYTAHPTKATASALITLTLEENWDRVQGMEGYAKYIALRPRAERLGEHGLFGDDDGVDLAAVADELDHYTGNVWTHIISLHREDAARLGYDHAEAWRTLLRTHRNDIAAAMKIPPEDFRWYAAFHDEGNHPHVHMMAWSAKPNQAYLSKDGIRQIKSTLTNQIFRQELLHVYEQKSKSLDELVAETRKAMLELAKAMREMTCIHPEAEQMIWDLSRQLGQVGGKKTYGYLPKPMKKLVDEIVDQMARLPTVDACYQTWWELQCQVEDYYSEGKERLRPLLSQQKEFRQIKNAVNSLALSTLLPKLTAPCDYGSITYDKKVVTDLGTGSFITLVNGKTGELTLEANRSGTDEGRLGTITVTISTSNYQDITLTINVSAENKITPQADGAVTATDITHGQTLNDSKIAGKVKDGDKMVNGTFAWVDGTGAVSYRIDTANSTGEATIDPNTGVLTPVKVGSVSVIATKAGDNDYNDVTSAPFVLMIKPATPTGAPNYTRITISGKTLKDAALTIEGSTPNPNDGKLEWVDDKENVLSGNTTVEDNTAYKWRLTPTDTNYTTLTGEVELYHKSSGGGSGVTAPSITVPVSSEQETVKVDAIVFGSTAAVEVTDKQLDQVTSGGDIVTVDVSGLKDVDSAKGTGETTFSPNADCTRAQIVTLLWRCKK